MLLYASQGHSCADLLRLQPQARQRPTSAPAPASKERRLQEALAEDKAARQRERARASMLRAEVKSEAQQASTAANSASAVAEAAKGAPVRSDKVRVTLCALDRPSDRKPVVLQREGAAFRRPKLVGSASTLPWVVDR